MSLETTVINALVKVRDQFIKRVAERYGHPVEELESLWENGVKSKKKVSIKDLGPNVSPELIKMSKPELVELCKAKNLRYSGTKAVLIERLTNGDSAPKKVSKAPKKESKASKSKVVKKLIAQVPSIEVRRNAHGNHEHAETGLVFDRKTKKVIGTQNSDGSINTLTEDDIDTCNRFKFEYVLPDNLDNNEDEAVDELDEEEEFVEEDEELVLENEEDDEEFVEELVDEEDEEYDD